VVAWRRGSVARLPCGTRPVDVDQLAWPADDVGGGISQIATTVFNAVFFGGYPIHQPHSYYIRRYPMGREATVSLPAPDLVFTNDTKAGILIYTSYTDTAITVTLYGD
jgi:vancomycin resistance protein YoaR